MTTLSPLTRVIVTGGVATGKSSACAIFREWWPEAVFFDCDAEVHRLLTEPEILRILREFFGDRCFEPSGAVNRKALRSRVFAEPQGRQFLESLLHPLVAARYRSEIGRGQSEARELILADVPLYFETAERFPADHVLVVGVRPATQLRRLLRRDGLTPESAEAMLSAQIPIIEKMKRADHVLWNEGPPLCLRGQVLLFRTYLQRPNQV